MNDLIQDIPKIVINHATPMIPEYGYDEDTVLNGGYIFQGEKQRRIYGMKEMVGDNFMIVNSYEAVERNQGGFPIIHGMDKDEWWDLPKEPRVVTVLSPGGYDKYYNRQLLEYVKSQLYERYAIKLFQFSVDYKPQNWDEYRDFLGRSLIHFYPGYDSPMPRGRTEAMLSGCCSVTTKHHGADKFTITGFNGFVVPDNPLTISDLIAKLMYEEFKYAEDVGRMGKLTAQKIFRVDRYLDTWWKVINCVLENGSMKAQEILNKEWRMYEVFEPVKELAKDFSLEVGEKN
jgi:glycosyltransferase involved in cell wall biosynthesis